MIYFKVLRGEPMTSGISMGKKKFFPLVSLLFAAALLWTSSPAPAG